MADIPINPTNLLNQLQQAGQTSQVSGNSSVLSIPPAIANSSVGTFLNAIVQGSDNNGNTILTTPNGQLTVASKITLPDNSRLVLRVSANNINNAGNNSGNIFQARITSMNGQPFNSQNFVSGAASQSTVASAVENNNPATIISAQTPAVQPTTIPATATTIPPNINQNLNLQTTINAQSTAAFNSTGSKASGGNGSGQEDGIAATPAEPTAPAGFNLQQDTAGLDILRAVPTPPGQANAIIQQAPTNPVNIESSVSIFTQGQSVEGVIVSPSPNAAKFLPPTLVQNIPQTVGLVQSNKVAGTPIEGTGLLKTSDTITFKVLSAEFPTIPQEAVAQTGVQASIAGQGNLAKASVSSGDAQADPLQVSNADIQAGKLPGIVIANEKGGEPIIKTPLGNIRLETETSLPKGTTLALQLLEVETNNNYVSITQEQSKLLASSRNNISQAVDYLRANSPDVADKVLKTAVPQLDKDFAVKLFSFFTNYKANGASSIFNNDARKVLEDGGQGNLLQKIGQDLSLAKQLVANNPNNWSSMLFPIYDGKELQYGLLHYKRERGEQNSPESRGVKFIVEVDLTKMGAMHLEGEILNKKPSKEFNLMVRTKNRLNPDVQKGISEIFLESAEITGNDGVLQFVLDKNLAPLAFAQPPEDNNSFFA